MTAYSPWEVAIWVLSVFLLGSIVGALIGYRMLQEWRHARRRFERTR